MNLSGFLGTTPLFKGLPDDILDEITAISRVKAVNREQVVFNEGDEAHGFYIVLEGMVKICKLSSEGKEQILHIFGPGEPFGEVAVFAGGVFPANAIALSEGKIIFTDRREFGGLVKRHPSLSFNMLAILSMRLRKFAAIIENLSLKEVPGRLAAFILMMSGERGNQDTFQLDMTKGQVANTLGTTPETLSRILKLMHERGCVSYRKKTVSILDRQMLEDLSEGIEKIR